MSAHTSRFFASPFVVGVVVADDVSPAEVGEPGNGVTLGGGDPGWFSPAHPAITAMNMSDPAINTGNRDDITQPFPGLTTPQRDLNVRVLPDA